MRIAIVADTYPPLRTSGAVQIRDLAREFSIQGHNNGHRPGHRSLNPTKLEQADGVTVLRCRTPATKDIGYVRRTINEMRLPHALLRALSKSDLSNAPLGRCRVVLADHFPWADGPRVAARKPDVPPT